MIFCAWLAYILAYTVDYVHLPSVIRRRAQDKRTEANVGGDQIHLVPTLTKLEGTCPTGRMGWVRIYTACTAPILCSYCAVIGALEVCR